MNAGLFISFEGGEGSGKTTQINKLAAHLNTKGYTVVTTREPGGTEEGDKIRSLIVQRDGGNWTPLAECLLLFAARHMHVEKIIKPALEEGAIVISDRFTDSTRAYQGHGRGFSLETIEKLNDITLENFKPDLTLVLDIDPKTGLSRSGRRLAAEKLSVDQTEDRFENLDLDFHERLRQGFLAIAKKDSKRCKVFDAAQPADKLAAQLAATVEERLK